MISKLHDMGVTSKAMYTAGLASIGLSFASWLISKNLESTGVDRADRWGIFIGQWAPTCFAMGVALRIEEFEEAERMEAETGSRFTTETKRPVGV
ncbi:hypothetical protein [Nonomuraea sp. NPDC046570]|uniref:hypothetical protein n=1 Tax=Nonomuraea sp. NPDC046570 TaxID=3155255 RepID=UPI0033CC8E37